MSRSTKATNFVVPVWIPGSLRCGPMIPAVSIVQWTSCVAWNRYVSRNWLHEGASRPVPGCVVPVAGKLRRYDPPAQAQSLGAQGRRSCAGADTDGAVQGKARTATTGDLGAARARAGALPDLLHTVSFGAWQR